MDEHIQRVEELFSAVKTEFKHLEFYDFHNCVYDFMWKNNRRRFAEKFPTWDIIRKYNKDYKLIFVGDATMSPYEILQPGGSVEYNNEEPGAEWIQRLTHAFPKFAWTKPEPQGSAGNTARASASSSSSSATACSRCHSRGWKHDAPAVEERCASASPRPRGRSCPTLGACFCRHSAGAVRRHTCALLRHCHRFMISSSSVFASRVHVPCKAQPHPTPTLWSALLLCGALVLQGCSVLSPRQEAEPAAAVTTEDQPAFSLEVKAPDSVRDTLERHLELQRFRLLPDLQNEELRRLLHAATPTLANCWARWGTSRPPLRLSCERPLRHNRRTPSPSPWSPARTRVTGRHPPDRRGRNRARCPRAPAAAGKKQLVAARRQPLHGKAPGQARSSGLRQLQMRRSYPTASIASSRAEVDADTHEGPSWP